MSGGGSPAAYDPNACGALGHMAQGGQGQRLLGIIPEFTFPAVMDLGQNAPLAPLFQTHPKFKEGYGNPNGLLMRVLRALGISRMAIQPGASQDQQSYDAGGGGDSGVRPLDTPAFEAHHHGGGGMEMDH